MRRWLAVVGMCAACAPAWKAEPHAKVYQGVPAPILHPPVQENVPHDFWYGLVHSTTRPLGQALSPGTYLGLATGGPEAADVNLFGQVLDSPWFTNRIGRYALSPAALGRGPNTLLGPAPGRLLVVGGKLAGATPGLTVRDSVGNTFVVKFDPPAFPELSSAAELIATKFLWAAGYNVPENYIQTFDIDRLDLDPSATTRGEYNEIVPLTRQRLNDLITHVNPYPDGSIRALFSRVIAGRDLGPFTYRQIRENDPNDTVYHEHRRSLRGLWVFNAWLNNVDTRSANSLDVFIPSPDDPEVGHIVHYLLDFGDSLGAAGVTMKYKRQGYEHTVDWLEIGKTIFSAGIYYPHWLPAQRSPYRSVGVFEDEVFDPSKWRPNIPNAAFTNATALDTYWAASILARLTPAHIASVVESAEYSEPGASEWVTRVLSGRQRRILEYAFERVLPLEDAMVEERYIVGMLDLAVERGLLAADAADYRYVLRWNRTGAIDVELESGIMPLAIMDTRPAVETLRTERPEDFAEDPFLTLRWERAAGGPAVELHLRVLEKRVLPVGLTREVD